MHPTMLTVVDDLGRIKDEVKMILDQIAKADAVLSAGHLHISEIWPLFAEAKARGVQRRLVNHPTFVIDASLADISELAADGAFIEHSMCMFTPDCRFKLYEPDVLDSVVKAGTFEQTILGSDLGQVGNPTPVEGFRRVIGVLLDLGYSEERIAALTGGNAARLMGLEGAGR
jgi:microsomal dipeptidase-like Zn-dependent dipeptidase